MSIRIGPRAEVLLFAGIALAVRLAHVQTATPWYDDFYHLLAARSWLTDGTFSIAEGQYLRAAAFTRLVAASLSVFGDSLAAGRIPAVLAGTLWATAVFAWTRHVAGGLAAWCAGLIFALDPGSIHLAQWVRFYTLQGLLVWIGAIAVYHLVQGPASRLRAASLAVVAFVAFAFGVELVRSTLIAVAGASLWAAGVLLTRLPSARARGPAVRWTLAGGLAGILAVGVWVVLAGTVSDLWSTYTSPFYWQEGREISRRWYAWWLSERYPTLFTLFPVAVALAVARNPRPALFSLTMFGTAAVGVSFAAGQAERYLYFGLPFFFVLWGLALASLIPALRTATQRALDAVNAPGLSTRWLRPVVLAFTVLTLAFIASQSNASRMTIRMLAPGGSDRPYRLADWDSVLPELHPLVESADVVLSTYLLKPLYYLGRGDIHLSWTETAESGFRDGQPVEFARDFRTGRPAISTAESLERVMACFASGLVLTERFHLELPHIVPTETGDFLRARTTEIPLPPASWVRAFVWSHEAPIAGADCPPWPAVFP